MFAKQTESIVMFNFLDDTVRQCVERIQKLGGSIICHEKGAPATSSQIGEVDRRFGGRTPPELLQLGLFANSYEFVWKIDCPGDPYFGGICLPRGRLSWNFSALQPLDPLDFWWAEEILAGERDGVWHEKAIIHCATDGDFLAYTIDPALLHVPVYCAKDGCACGSNGPSELVLGASLSEFFQEWAKIAFLSINDFYDWTHRTGRQTFDASYFDTFVNLLTQST